MLDLANAGFEIGRGRENQAPGTQPIIEPENSSQGVPESPEPGSHPALRPNGPHLGCSWRMGHTPETVSPHLPQPCALVWNLCPLLWGEDAHGSVSSPSWPPWEPCSREPGVCPGQAGKLPRVASPARFAVLLDWARDWTPGTRGLGNNKQLSWLQCLAKLAAALQNSPLRSAANSHTSLRKIRRS